MRTFLFMPIFSVPFIYLKSNEYTLFHSVCPSSFVICPDVLFLSQGFLLDYHYCNAVAVHLQMVSVSWFYSIAVEMWLELYHIFSCVLIPALTQSTEAVTLRVGQWIKASHTTAASNKKLTRSDLCVNWLVHDVPPVTQSPPLRCGWSTIQNRFVISEMFSARFDLKSCPVFWCSPWFSLFLIISCIVFFSFPAPTGSFGPGQWKIPGYVWFWGRKEELPAAYG